MIVRIGPSYAKWYCLRTMVAPIHLSCNNTISEVRNSPIFNIQLLFISYRISLHSRFSQTRAIWLFYNHCPTRVTVVAELSTIEVRRLKRRFIRRPSSFHKHHPFLVNAAHYAAELGNIAIGSVTSVSWSTWRSDDLTRWHTQRTGNKLGTPYTVREPNSKPLLLGHHPDSQ